MNRLIISSFFCCVIILTSAFKIGNTIPKYKVKTIVIDAGHGGHDPGCFGASNREKIVALSVALKLGNLIEESFPDVKVVYTRKTDVFIPLIERAEIANKAHADLFISIHCNASKAKTAYGTESWVMGLHVSEANLAVAKRENSVILLEEDYKENYDGFDPNSAEAYITFSLYQNVNIDKSLYLASKVETAFKTKMERFSRGIKQAGFLVLYKTNMPAILIETGFLTNLNDEKILGSEKGQTDIAETIYSAVKEYKSDVEIN